MTTHTVRRQHSGMEESLDMCSSSSKKQELEYLDDHQDSYDYEDSEDYKQAIRVLQERKNTHLLLVRSKLNQSIEDAHNLAAAEKKRMEETFKVRSQEIKKRIVEDNQMKTRSMAAEESKLKNHLSKLDFPSSNGSAFMPSKKDQCCFNVLLNEDDMIDDLLFMSHNTKELCDQCQVPPICTAVPLSNNRLLLNDHVIYPNTPCTVRIGATRMYGCVFISTVVKEKEFKEKRKEPEFVVKVSATRKRRFPIESLRNGDIELIFKDEDIHFMKGIKNEYVDSDERDIYNDDSS